MNSLAKEIARVKELRDRPCAHPPHYDAERCQELRRKHAADPESYKEWQDIAADDAGIKRHGEL